MFRTNNCSSSLTYFCTGNIKYSVIRKDGLNFVHLYFLNCTRYVSELHNVWKRTSSIFKYHRYSARLVHNRAAASVESKMATKQHKIFCFREFIKTDSPTVVQRAFRLRFNIQPSTRKSVCRWTHEFEQIDRLCKGESSGRPSVSEENVRRIQDSFERSPRKSTRRTRRKLGIPQPTVWRVLRRRLLFSWVNLFESPCILLCIYGVSGC